MRTAGIGGAGASATYIAAGASARSISTRSACHRHRAGGGKATVNSCRGDGGAARSHSRYLAGAIHCRDSVIAAALRNVANGGILWGNRDGELVGIARIHAHACGGDTYVGDVNQHGSRRKHLHRADCGKAAFNSCHGDGRHALSHACGNAGGAHRGEAVYPSNQKTTRLICTVRRSQ